MNVNVLGAFCKSRLVQNKYLKINFGLVPLAIRHLLFFWLSKTDITFTGHGLDSEFAEQEAFLLWVEHPLVQNLVWNFWICRLLVCICLINPNVLNLVEQVINFGSVRLVYSLELATFVHFKHARQRYVIIFDL